MEIICRRHILSCAALFCLCVTGLATAQNATSISLDSPEVIRPAELDTQDLFGMDIAIDGNFAIVSSKRFLYFYNQQINGNWQLQSTLGTEPGNWFSELELAGDTLIVSKRNQTEVYKKNNAGNWQLESDTLPASAFVEYDGVRLMLGDYAFRTGDSSFTSIYSRNSHNSWSREFHITDRVGNMDIDGDFAAIRADGNTYIYNRNLYTGEWQEAGVLSVQDYPFGDVSLHNGFLLIGYEGQSANNGFAYLYSRVAGGRWQLEDIFRGRVDAAPGQDVYQGSIGDRFGSFVELTDNKVVIGAHWGNYASLTGLIYRFQRSSDTAEWRETHVLLSPDDYDGYPEGVAYTDDFLLAGGIYTGAESGVVYSYDLSPAEAGSCVDTDGDGYGWNGLNTCIPTTENDNCDYSDAHLYDGWGWDPINFESCAPQNQESSDEDCDYASANLNDGWGWNPVTQQSCAPPTDAEIQPGNCDYSDAPLYAGWGWDPVTMQSCAPR